MGNKTLSPDPGNQDDLPIFTGHGRTSGTHQVLTRLNCHNVKLRQSKCAFAQSEVVYIGHKVDINEHRPVKVNVEAIVNAPKPNNVSELRSFLGMVQPV